MLLQLFRKGEKTGQEFNGRNGHDPVLPFHTLTMSIVEEPIGFAISEWAVSASYQYPRQKPFGKKM